MIQDASIYDYEEMNYAFLKCIIAPFILKANKYYIL